MPSQKVLLALSALVFVFQIGVVHGKTSACTEVVGAGWCKMTSCDAVEGDDTFNWCENFWLDTERVSFHSLDKVTCTYDVWQDKRISSPYGTRAPDSVAHPSWYQGCQRAMRMLCQLQKDPVSCWLPGFDKANDPTGLDPTEYPTPLELLEEWPKEDAGTSVSSKSWYYPTAHKNYDFDQEAINFGRPMQVATVGGGDLRKAYCKNVCKDASQLEDDRTECCELGCQASLYEMCHDHTTEKYQGLSAPVSPTAKTGKQTESGVHITSSEFQDDRGIRSGGYLTDEQRDSPDTAAGGANAAAVQQQLTQASAADAAQDATGSNDGTYETAGQNEGADNGGVLMNGGGSSEATQSDTNQGASSNDVQDQSTGGGNDASGNDDGAYQVASASSAQQAGEEAAAADQTDTSVANANDANDANEVAASESGSVDDGHPANDQDSTAGGGATVTATEITRGDGGDTPSDEQASVDNENNSNGGSGAGSSTNSLKPAAHVLSAAL